MKKIILISMIASGMLLAGSVTDLTTDVVNEIDNGLPAVINNANVSQGHTVVSGDSTITDLIITQKDPNGGTGNIIKNVSIDSATVNQGLTHINNGKVSNSILNSNSAIFDSLITTDSTVNQASTIVNDGAELEHTEVTSNNTLTGKVTGGSNVSQATLELNGDDTELEDSILNSTNSIVAYIDASEVHQAKVSIGGGYKVASLTMTSTNTFNGDISNSKMIQGGLDVCSHEGDASDWCED